MAGAEFTDAVALATQILGPFVKDRQFCASAFEPEEILLRFGVPFIQVPDYHGTYFLYPKGAAEWLVSRAEVSRAAFDLLCQIVASKVQRGEELTEPLRIFAVLRIGAGLLPPERASKRSSTFAANLILLMTARLIEMNCSLPLTRNEASEPKSACDAVSQALSQLGHARSWRAIKELIVNKKSLNLRKDLEELLARLEDLHRKIPATKNFFKVVGPRSRQDGDGG